VSIQKEQKSGWGYKHSAISRQLKFLFKSILLKAERCQLKTIVFGWTQVYI
jgi:hypothetical protein